MNLEHDHSKATPSRESDLLEGEVESILNDITLLLRELTSRMQRTVFILFPLFFAILLIVVISMAVCLKKRSSSVCS
ncbi:MAG TPA: hypothetical protein PLE24_07140 [Chitinispirillaceae bacterium]|jgi:hypothetical protein|nr:hypothetical protein [Chitinispirillaceae bacterium]